MSDSNYENVGFDNPDDVFKVYSRISTFGGPKDKEDSGQFAFGGSSITPEGTESQENYAAIDPAWYKNGVRPGSTINVVNPETGASVPVVLRDKGPARWTGRGIDVAPHVMQQLGMDTDQKAILDFKPALMGAGAEGNSDLTQQGAAPDVLQTQPQNFDPNNPPNANLITAQAVDQAIQEQPQGSMLASVNAPSAQAQPDITATSDEALQGITQLPDGGYDLGNGLVGYENGIIQARTGNSVTEYIPDPSNPSGYKTHTFNVKSTAKNPKEVMQNEGAKKGIIREDFPAGPEGDKAYEDELKLTLGAGVADDIAEAITSGKQPPDTKGLYRTGPQVRAKLAKMGYDLKNANLDWQAAQKFVLSQNSPPLVRLRSSANTALHSLDLIDEYASQWKAGNFPVLNHANLVLAQQGALGPEAAKLARLLDGQITDLTFELGNVYMGGNTPTDQSLALAKKNLSADWQEPVLHEMTNLARRNLQIRLNSFKQVEPAGMSEEGLKEERWMKTQQQGSATQPSSTPSGSPVQYREGQSVKLRNGQVVTIKKINPDGTFEY